MDEDNFEFIMGQWYVIMTNGELLINNCSYEENEDDPMYDFARELWRLKQMSTN